MAKVKYVGETRRTFTWTSMGKTMSYSVSPNDIIDLADNQLPYLLSFGNMLVKIQETHKANKPKVEPVAPVKVDPIIAPVVVPVPVAAPVVESLPAPAPAEIVSEVPSVFVDEEEEEVESASEEKVDYTGMTKSELKKLCKNRGLDTVGNRDDLICNLVGYDREKLSK
jgi:hypothetical protein